MTSRIATGSAGIIGTGMAVPPRVLTNFDLEKMVDTSDEWIVTRTGIRERHIADPEVTTSDLAVEAALKALADASISPEEIDLIIVATVTPDNAFPSTACIVQDRIGAKNAAAFDLSAGCSGFVYALDMAFRCVRSGGYGKVLVIGAECLSKITDWTDRSTCVLFGDGAGAVVIGAVEEGLGFVESVLGADGSGGDKLILPAGGSRFPASEDTVAKGLHYLKMDGNEIFKFAVRILDQVTRQVLAKSGETIENVDWFIPHQANVRIIDAAIKRLGLSPKRVIQNLENYGNTSAASIAIALEETNRAGKFHKGDLIVLAGFGAGLTWAGMTLRWAI